MVVSMLYYIFRDYPIFRKKISTDIYSTIHTIEFVLHEAQIERVYIYIHKNQNSKGLVKIKEKCLLADCLEYAYAKMCKGSSFVSI